MTNEKKINTLNLIKDIFLSILISLLFFIPFLKQIVPIYKFVMEHHYIYLGFIGIIGAVFFVLNIYLSFEKNTNKKQFFKDMLPIFILLLYMIWTFISAIFAENRYLAFYGTDYRKDGYFSYILYAGCFGLSFCIDSKKIKKLLLYVFVIGAVLVVIFTQIAASGHLYRLFFNINVSFSQFNHYGYYLLLATAISSFLFISEKNIFVKIINLLMYTYLLYYLILNNTFGCYLALFLTFIIFLLTALIKKEKRIFIEIAILVFIITSFFGKTTEKNIASDNLTTFSKDIKNIVSTDHKQSDVEKAGTGRMKLWIYGMKFFSERPILGYGPENLGAKYAEAKIGQDRPHNILVQLITTSGLPG